MIARLVIQTVLWLAGIGALLFGAAGTVAWPAGWWYLLEMGALGIWMGLRLAKDDPALLEERLKPFIQREQGLWDKVFMALVAIVWCAWLVLMALDAARFRWSSVPLWLNVAGALAIFLCIWMTGFVFRANSFAAPVVKIQSERGHKVADTGPYAWVRHPMYSAAILFFIGLPLLLGSWWGLACAPLLVAGLGARAVMEERMLIAQLPGYADYAARVRYRLVPGIW
ncbi:isoprenylcysteine carboxylmethyltransferase family protein [Paraburkholderia sp. BL10I2N1]|uniref:methyltransferase family protein n=1 Tax=Paraburkholderia sp. BL10I2N1 TaxID=1938796 RepID=UPI00105E6DB5|nr:isoprenylcysteine carboxylmethyltransferase family protein [Paraburkholderia sp. BL10I2N1]TDN63495.1 protein-S-isoprenylcysteine O-methyltransferase Ste14 [Paraburkholderia sp. BL10I2N1]